MCVVGCKEHVEATSTNTASARQFLCIIGDIESSSGSKNVEDKTLSPPGREIVGGRMKWSTLRSACVRSRMYVYLFDGITKRANYIAEGEQHSPNLMTRLIAIAVSRTKWCRIDYSAISIATSDKVHLHATAYRGVRRP